MDCSRFSRFRWAYVFRFSLLVGWTVRSCGYVTFCYDLSLGLPLTAPFFPISYSASPFHQRIFPLNVAGVEEYCKTALVQLVLQENGYPIQSKLLTIYIPTTVSGKMNDPTAVSANPTKEKANLHVAAGTNDLSTNNEKRAIHAQQPD